MKERAVRLGERALNASSGLAVQFPDGRAREHYEGFAVLPLAGVTTGGQVDVWLDNNSGDALRLPVGAVIPLPFESVWLRSVDTTTPRYRVVAFRELPPSVVDALVRSSATSGLVPLVGIVDGAGTRVGVNATALGLYVVPLTSGGAYQGSTASADWGNQALASLATLYAITAVEAAFANGSARTLRGTSTGMPGSTIVALTLPESQGSASLSGLAAGSTTTLIAAPASGSRLYLHSFRWNSSVAVATKVTLQEIGGGRLVEEINLSTVGGDMRSYLPPDRAASATGYEVVVAGAGASIDAKAHYSTWR